MRTTTGRIERQGPFVYVMVMATHYQVSTLKAQGLPYPPPQQVAALIDTVASASVLDHGVIAAPGLTLVGQTSIHTPSTGSQYELRNQYAASISLIDASVDPGQGIKTFKVGAIESHLASEGFRAIIGWDILSDCILTCDGPSRTFRLEF